MEQLYINQPWSAQQMKFSHIIPDMKQVEDLLYETIGTGHGTIGEMCTYLLGSGGKRLRPLLTVLSGKALDPECSMPLAAAGAAAELIHMASLVHDDIIDQSLYRRGKPSLYALWGQKNAVLAGDFLFAKAFDLLAGHQLFPVLQLMVQAIQEMCQGEITQSDNLFQVNQKEEDYFQRIDQKTGKLLAACCQSGAMIAHGTPAQEAALKSYGTFLGYTYQIVDDLLDFTGNSETLGKPVCQDLTQGNLTLPILYLIPHQEHGAWVRNIIGEKELNAANCAKIIHLMKQTGLLEQCQRVAAHCGDKAKNALIQLPSGMYRTMLEMMVDKALNRTC